MHLRRPAVLIKETCNWEKKLKTKEWVVSVFSVTKSTVQSNRTDFNEIDIRCHISCKIRWWLNTILSQGWSVTYYHVSKPLGKQYKLWKKPSFVTIYSALQWTVNLNRTVDRKTGKQNASQIIQIKHIYATGILYPPTQSTQIVIYWTTRYWTQFSRSREPDRSLQEPKPATATFHVITPSYTNEQFEDPEKHTSGLIMG
jgi:hypothetical protein